MNDVTNLFTIFEALYKFSLGATTYLWVQGEIKI